MEVKRVGVVGSGIMGAGVAEVAAKAGFEVTLRSRAQSSADAMAAGLEKSLQRQVEKGRLDDADRGATLERLQVVTDLGELENCDLVLEIGRRGSAHQAAPLHRARPGLRRRGDPGHQHLDPPGRGPRHADRTPGPGLRRPLLQPGAR